MIDWVWGVRERERERDNCWMFIWGDHVRGNNIKLGTTEGAQQYIEKDTAPLVLSLS